MNLWLRLFYVLFFTFLAKKQDSPSRTLFRIYRAWPWDCDVNGHLTNSRYFSFMDLSRLDFLISTGLWSFNPYCKKSYFFILQSTEISFIRPIMPGSMFCISTQILGFDEKYCYIQHNFFSKKSLFATARARTVLRNKWNQKIETSALAEYGITEINQGSIAKWKDYLSLKTEETTQSFALHPNS